MTKPQIRAAVVIWRVGLVLLMMECVALGWLGYKP